MLVAYHGHTSHPRTVEKRRHGMFGVSEKRKASRVATTGGIMRDLSTIKPQAQERHASQECLREEKMSSIQRVRIFGKDSPRWTFSRYCMISRLPASYLPCVAWYVMKNSLADGHACKC
jgi:hypothetical protein